MAIASDTVVTGQCHCGVDVCPVIGILVCSRLDLWVFVVIHIIPSGLWFVTWVIQKARSIIKTIFIFAERTCLTNSEKDILGLRNYAIFQRKLRGLQGEGSL